MNTRQIKNIFICFFVFISCFSFSQQNKIDSLLSLVKTDKPNTNKVKNLNNLSRQYINIGSYDSAVHYGNTALQLAQQLKFRRGIAQSYNIIGIVYNDYGDYPKALDCYFKALKINENIEDKIGISKNLGNIGTVYTEQKDYTKALDYYFKTLKTFEELGNKNGIATTLGNIGIVYKEQGDLITYDSLRQINYTKALDYYFKALKMDEELGNKNGVARHLGNIGNVYNDQKDYTRALDYYFRALKMAEELGDKSGITNVLCNIGLLYTSTKKYTEAENYLLKALSIADEIGSLDDIREENKNLSELYTQTGNYKKALEHFKKAIEAKDSLFSLEKNKELTRLEMNYEFEKKEALAKAEQEKKDLITMFSLIGFFLTLGFLVFAFRSLRVTTKQTFLLIRNFLGTLATRPKIFGRKEDNE